VSHALLNRLRVQCFRNLHNLELEVGAGRNWIIGANAAGKTALLEALYCLSRGRSFRGRRFGSLIERGASRALVEGWIEHEGSLRRLRWASAQGEVLREPDSLEPMLPVRLICEWTHALVDGEPSLRRRFVDWNLVLWERSAAAAFSRFRRVAAQRNAWLRSGGVGRAVWDLAYAEALAEILRWRASFFAEFALLFRRLSLEEDWFTEIDLRWDGLSADTEELMARLEEMRAVDKERGFTYLGISRADFSFRCDGLKWFGSRGQAKVLGCLLQVAAEQLVSAADGSRALWLVDDLDAELAPAWSRRLIDLLGRQSYQTVYTLLPGKSVSEQALGAADRMFHVEHGQLMAREAT